LPSAASSSIRRERLFDRGDLLARREIGCLRRDLALDQRARTDQLRAGPTRLRVPGVRRLGLTRTLDARAAANLDQAFDFERDQCLAH